MSMGRSRLDETRVLLVVEGEKAEPLFLNALAATFNIHVQIVPICANLHMLYGKMQELGFDCDVRDALKELKLSPQQLRRLDKKFAYTYLVFDCDAQHDSPDKKGTPPRSAEEKFAENMHHLVEMAQYFDNETDPSKGRLYVNWPMMESYRDCDSFFDVTYRDRFVPIGECKFYKEAVGTKKNASLRPRSYGKSRFSSLIKMNLWKLGLLCRGEWGDMTYDDYINRCSQGWVIAKRQEQLVREEGKVAVLNTSLFFPVDYFGKSFFKTMETCASDN